MATSIQTCLPNNTCKHEIPLKSSTRSPNFLRYGYSSMPRPNSAHRKSAVERLEESKANYVKSECVLDSKQKFKHSSHLQVSIGPQLNVLRKGPLKHYHSHDLSLLKSQTNFSIHDPDQNQSLNSQEHQQVVLCSKSQGPIRARAKSQSEVRDSQNRRKLSFLSHGSGKSNDELGDLESQLKRLISSNSKENINLISASNFSIPSRINNEGPKVHRGFSDPIKKDSSLTPRHVQERNYNIHKSLPDLSPSLHEPLSKEETPSSESSDDSLFWQDKTDLEINQSSYLSSEFITNNSSYKYDSLIDQEEMYVDCLRNDCPVTEINNGADTLKSLRREWNSDTVRRNLVSRSKSDVSHRYSKVQTEHVTRRNSYCTAELERFFDMMGLDTMVWHNITSPTHLSSPPRFFDSVSSINSDDHRSSICSEDSFSEIPREGLTNRDLREHGPIETSIVEKNARVIKWLYNCRKALKEPGS